MGLPSVESVIAKAGMNADIDTGEVFALEPSIPGRVPKSTLDMLVHARSEARSVARAFADGIEHAAENYNIKPAALRRYVCAVEANSVDKVKAETDDLESLLGA